ncbi:MAG: ferredoxin reductase [Actinobacteria bacterium]|nr:ferredoxin reductase [Actinomycetota bacterium]
MRPETDTARTLVFDVPGWPGHLPGQHLDVRLTAEDGYETERSYSIASPPERPGVEITVELIEDGEVSPNLVEDLRPGDQLELRGPIGGYFTWQAADGGPLILVAGGSGLVPLMAMLRHRDEAGAHVPVSVLVSARTFPAVLYRDELMRSARDDVEVNYTLTRETPPGWTGWTRRVDAEMLRDVGADAQRRPLVYVCGPTAFVEHVAGLLVDLGHDPHAIRTERFGPSGG